VGGERCAQVFGGEAWGKETITRLVCAIK
jgi:hypothetical protein